MSWLNPILIGKKSLEMWLKCFRKHVLDSSQAGLCLWERDTLQHDFSKTSFRRYSRCPKSSRMHWPVMSWWSLPSHKGLVAMLEVEHVFALCAPDQGSRCRLRTSV